jgi:hypothetical protein
MMDQSELAGLELVEPESPKAIEKSGQCTLGTFLLNNDKQLDVLVKVERRESIVAWVREAKYSTMTTTKTYCANEVVKMTNSYVKLSSMEAYVAKLVESKPRFIKFYPDNSLPLVTMASSIGSIATRSSKNSVQVIHTV